MLLSTEQHTSGMNTRSIFWRPNAVAVV